MKELSYKTFNGNDDISVRGELYRFIKENKITDIISITENKTYTLLSITVYYWH